MRWLRLSPRPTPIDQCRKGNRVMCQERQIRHTWAIRVMFSIHTTEGWLLTTALLASALLPVGVVAQGAPPAPGVVWRPRGAQALEKESAARQHDQVNFAPGQTYTLAELID